MRRETAGEPRRLEGTGEGETAWNDEATDERAVAEESIGGRAREATRVREPGADWRECMMDETKENGADGHSNGDADRLQDGHGDAVLAGAGA